MVSCDSTRSCTGLEARGASAVWACSCGDPCGSCLRPSPPPTYIATLRQHDKPWLRALSSSPQIVHLLLITGEGFLPPNTQAESCMSYLARKITVADRSHCSQGGYCHQHQTLSQYIR